WQMRPVISRRRLRHEFAELLPVGDLVLFADFFAGERPVLETDQRHVTARLRTKDVAFAHFSRLAVLHRAEKRIARAEADGELPGLPQTKPHGACRIIARPDSGQRFG